MEGAKAFKEKKFAIAITFFEAAYQKDNNPTILYNLGKSYLENNDQPKALGIFTQYISTYPTESNTSEIKTIIALLKNNLPPGKLFINIVPEDGLIVTISGESIGENKSVDELGWKLKTDIELRPGTYSLRAIYISSNKAVEEIIISSGETTRWSPDIDIGKKKQPGSQPLHIAPLNKPWYTDHSTLGLGAISIGGLLSAAGIWAHIEARSKAEEATKRWKNYRTDWRDPAKDAQTSQYLAIASWILGGTALGAGTYILWSRDEDTPIPTVQTDGKKTFFGISGSF
ncbi:MAG: hypothetical protein HOE80_02465 [Candidatus Magasanikbacteria bacterium]|nr:hypothetical protein [Candidatus Magasanikbacteria bacterium]MBT4071564.1 hypothetical protein [Candidatus Magasanikbacteria bacterium]